MAEILSIGELLDLGGSASTAGLIPYSALEYSAQVITGISGSAIGGQGGTDSATVSAIASAYAESAASGKLDQSASGLWYPLTGNPSGFLTGVDLTPYAYESSVSSKVDQSAFDNCCSSMSSVVSSLETSVTSMSSVVSGLTGDYLEKSASSMFQPSGDYAYESALSSYIPVSASSQFAPSGDYAEASALSSKLDASASSQFQPSGNYQPSGDYADASSLSAKLDASASSQFQPSGDYQTAGNYMSASESSAFYPMTGNPSGFLTEHQSLTAYQDRSSISAWTGDMSSISGKLDQSAFTSYSSTVNNNITSIENNITAISSVVSGKADASAVHTYTGIDPIVVDNTADTISLDATSMHFDSTMTAYMSGDSGFVGVNTAQFQPSGNYQTAGNYMSASESSSFYPMTGNPSSFIQASDLNGYASTAYVQSSVSGKLDASSQVVTACSSFEGLVRTINGNQISAYTSYFADSARIARNASRAFLGNGIYVPFSAFAYESSVSSKLDVTAAYTPTFGYDAEDKISSIDGSALAGGGGGMSYTSPSGTIDIDNVNGTIDAWNSSMRVDEHVTAASSIPGTARQVSNQDYFTLWTGSTIPGDTLYLSAYFTSNLGLISASAFGIKDGGVRTKIAEFLFDNTSSGSAASSIDDTYTSIAMMLSSQYYVPQTGQYSDSVSGLANVERPGQTASSTSVYENVLKDSMWQSLTAWATSQGWTP